MLRKAWLFTLNENFKFDTGIDLTKRMEKQAVNFGLSGSPSWWLMINDRGLLVINKGYSWDGCSPKFSLLGKIIGTPDGWPHPVTGLPKTYTASLVHDVLCQFADDPKMPFSRDEIDELFYSILKRNRFKFATVYYYGVRAYVRAKRFAKRVNGVFS